jgi:ankyrin repeat protein
MGAALFLQLASTATRVTTRFHEAAREGSVGVVELLLERGADPGMKSGDGRTAAELAAEGGPATVVALLGARGS